MAWPWNTVEKCSIIQGLEKIMAKCYVHRRSLWSIEVSGVQYLLQENPIKGISELQGNVSSENSLRQHCKYDAREWVNADAETVVTHSLSCDQLN